MGYEISIQREESQPKISLEEWINYLNNDSEFERIEKLSSLIDNENTITIPTPNSGLWKTVKDEIPFIFNEELGWINLNNPDDWIIEKMITIAKNLNAIVIGEENEEYS